MKDQVHSLLEERIQDAEDRFTLLLLEEPELLTMKGKLPPKLLMKEAVPTWYIEAYVDYLLKPRPRTHRYLYSHKEDTKAISQMLGHPNVPQDALVRLHEKFEADSWLDREIRYHRNSPFKKPNIWRSLETGLRSLTRDRDLEQKLALEGMLPKGFNKRQLPPPAPGFTVEWLPLGWDHLKVQCSRRKSPAQQRLERFYRAPPPEVPQGSLEALGLVDRALLAAHPKTEGEVLLKLLDDASPLIQFLLASNPQGPHLELFRKRELLQKDELCTGWKQWVALKLIDSGQLEDFIREKLAIRLVDATSNKFLIRELVASPALAGDQLRLLYQKRGSGNYQWHPQQMAPPLRKLEALFQLNPLSIQETILLHGNLSVQEAIDISAYQVDYPQLYASQDILIHRTDLTEESLKQMRAGRISALAIASLRKEDAITQSLLFLRRSLCSRNYSDVWPDLDGSMKTKMERYRFNWVARAAIATNVTLSDEILWQLALDGNYVVQALACKSLEEKRRHEAA